MKRTRLYVSAISIAVGLSGCGVEFSGKAANPTTTIAGAGFNTRDVLYAQLMLVHSLQAVTLANLALDVDTGASEAVKDIATHIKIEHAAEIEIMTLLLQAWGKSLTMAPTLEAVQLQTGILTDKHIAYINTLHDKTFDTEYLESMISHHEGSIDMARSEIVRGKNSSTLELAESVVDKRQSIIDDMNALLD